jgi:hypothetical protein
VIQFQLQLGKMPIQVGPQGVQPQGSEGNTQDG